MLRYRTKTCVRKCMSHADFNSPSGASRQFLCGEKMEVRARTRKGVADREHIQRTKALKEGQIYAAKLLMYPRAN